MMPDLTVRLFVLVLAAAALFLVGCGAETEDVAPAPGEPAPEEPAPEEPAEEEPLEEGVADADATMVELAEHEGSGYTGTAILTPFGDEVYADIEVRREDEAPEDEAMPGDDEAWDDDALFGLAAEIRSGTCDDPGDTVQAVARLQFGWGAENVDMSLNELTRGDRILVITRSEAAAARDAEDPFGEEDTGAPVDEEEAAPADEDILEQDREIVACGLIEAGVAPDWADEPADEDEWDDDEWTDEDDQGEDDLP
jgi:hypothetical protein